MRLFWFQFPDRPPVWNTWADVNWCFAFIVWSTLNRRPLQIDVQSLERIQNTCNFAPLIFLANFFSASNCPQCHFERFLSKCIIQNFRLLHSCCAPVQLSELYKHQEFARIDQSGAQSTSDGLRSLKRTIQAWGKNGKWWRKRKKEGRPTKYRVPSEYWNRVNANEFVWRPWLWWVSDMR